MRWCQNSSRSNQHFSTHFPRDCHRHQTGSLRLVARSNGLHKRPIWRSIRAEYHLPYSRENDLRLRRLEESRTAPGDILIFRINILAAASADDAGFDIKSSFLSLSRSPKPPRDHRWKWGPLWNADDPPSILGLHALQNSSADPRVVRILGLKRRRVDPRGCKLRRSADEEQCLSVSAAQRHDFYRRMNCPASERIPAQLKAIVLTHGVGNCSHWAVLNTQL